ncbi:MAG: hypothetical protein ABIQ35_03320 [Verrucomicrobiota bacterium]
MKTNLILSLAVLVLAGCETSHRAPYMGVGEYGFTFDLDNTPSPFRDTSYRPLNVRDLTRPIPVAATNQVTLNLGGPDLTVPGARIEAPVVPVDPPDVIVTPAVEIPVTPVAPAPPNP